MTQAAARYIRSIGPEFSSNVLRASDPIRKYSYTLTSILAWKKLLGLSKVCQEGF